MKRHVNVMGSGFKTNQPFSMTFWQIPKNAQKKMPNTCALHYRGGNRMASLFFGGGTITGLTAGENA